MVVYLCPFNEKLLARPGIVIMLSHVDRHKFVARLTWYTLGWGFKYVAK